MLTEKRSQNKGAIIADQELSVIMKVTNQCNYRCKYCFIEPSAPREKMSHETLRTIIEKLFSSSKYSTINFIWHGGEPLLRGLEFFNHVISLQEELNIQNKIYTNAIQTNGSLLNDETIDFFKENHIKIGLSLDGPREINNTTRHSKNNGTYDTTINKIMLLHKQGLTLGAIATITKHNYQYPMEIYKLFKENKIHMKIGQLVNSGKAKFRTEELRLLPEEYGEFMTNLFELWFNDKENVIGISPYESITKNLLEPSSKPKECIHAGECHKRFIAISPNGDIYPCGLYQGYKEFCYGNIHKLILDKIEETRAYKILELRKEITERLCGRCTFFQNCHGGCPFSAFSNNGDIFSKDYYCESFKMIFRHIAEKVSTVENVKAFKDKVKAIGGGGGGGGGGNGENYSISYNIEYSVWKDYAVVV